MTMGWPRSPAVLFGIAASFFVVLGIISLSIGVLNNPLPILRYGHVTLVPAGYLVMLAAVPFAIFGLIYGGIELAAPRVFQKSATRIHFVCTFFAVLESIRVYAFWAATTGNSSPDKMTSKSWEGAVAFLTLAGAAFVWNAYTSHRPESREAHRSVQAINSCVNAFQGPLTERRSLRDNWHMERNLASGLAARGVVLVLIASVVFWMLPDSGVSALSKMSAAMRNAQSWREDTVVDEPTKKAETTVEVYCPSRLHVVLHQVSDSGGKQSEASTESFWIEGTSYFWFGGDNQSNVARKWTISQGNGNQKTLACTQGQPSMDILLQPLSLVMRTGKIRKGSKRIVNGEQCRDWIASVSAEEGSRDEFGVCIGAGDLPLEVFTPGRQMVETYSQWNTPIRIEAPAIDQTSPQ